jgi:transposase
MAYDKKYKKRAVEFHGEGNSIRQTAKTFAISPNTLNDWIQQYRKEGDFIRKQRVYNRKITESALTEYLEQNPDAYQAEIAEHFNTSQSTVNRTLRHYKISRKKR